jgi:hypothetical protein
MAVVVVTQQFPWFIVAPLGFLLAVAYFRHLEATEARGSSRNVSRDGAGPVRRHQVPSRGESYGPAVVSH